MTSLLLTCGLASASWWTNAPTYSIQGGYGGGRPPTETSVQMAADGDLLRVRFTCAEPRVGELKPAVREADGPVWDDDCVELFLTPSPADPAAYYHIGFNALGTVYDSFIDHGKVETAWHSQATVQVEKRADAWIVEATIPFVAFDRTPVGDQWRANLGREWRQFAGGAATWQPLEMRFHDPPRFAPISFPGISQQPKIKKLNDRLDAVMVRPEIQKVGAALAEMGQLPGVANSALGQELAAAQRRLGDERPTERWAALGQVRTQLPSWKGRANEEVARKVRAKLAAASPASFALLATSPMLKWRPDELPAGVPVQALELHAARGEAESAQLLLTPLRGALADCRVTVEWAHPGIELELSWVDYVSVTTPTAVGFNLPGRYPDILRPLPPSFRVAAGQAQALWCTAWVGREVPPGQYHGRVRIAAGGDEQTLPITVQVHHAVLPERPALSTIVTSEPWQGIPYYGKENYAAVAERMARHCLRYRLTPNLALPWKTVFSQDAKGQWQAAWETFDAVTAAWFAAGATTAQVDSSLLEIDTPNQNSPAVAAKLRLLNQHLLEKKWNERFYFYIFDEPPGGQIPRIQAYSAFVRQHAPAVSLIGTTRFQEFAGIVTTWIPVNSHLNDANFLAFMLRRQRQGDRFWMYTCFNTAGTRDADNWKIDWTGVGHRALGTTLWRFGCSGYLYWQIDKWSLVPTTDAKPSDPQLKPDVIGGCNGDGFLFYPDPAGQLPPAPSIRLELTRDGFEDYELLALLQRELDAVAANPPRLAHYGSQFAAWHELLDTTKEVRRTDDFTLDPKAYENRHDAVLRALDALQLPK